MNFVESFFKEYFKEDQMAVYTHDYPESMVASEVNSEGWFRWKPIRGTLNEEDYSKIQIKYDLHFPISFIQWHSAYFFPGCDLPFVRLPGSMPNAPLVELEEHLDYDLAKKLISESIFPFASEGNDTGPYVFDAREQVLNNEYPIRVYNFDYNGDLEGLSEIIFSSFPKMLECLTHYLREIRKRPDFEIFPEFFAIDPFGAGKNGIDYWLSWAAVCKDRQ